MVEPADHGRLLPFIHIGLGRPPPGHTNGAPRSYFQHVYVAGGLLVPRGGERGADRLPEGFGDGYGVAPAPTRHRLEGPHRRVISDVLDAVSHRIGLGNADHPHVAIPDHLPPPPAR